MFTTVGILLTSLKGDIMFQDTASVVTENSANSGVMALLVVLIAAGLLFGSWAMRRAKKETEARASSGSGGTPKRKTK